MTKELPLIERSTVMSTARVTTRPARKVALVTGASSGIGFEMCRLLAARGFTLVLVARNKKLLSDFARELKSTFGVPVTAVALDLADPSSPGRLYSLLHRKRIQVDVLVNNAGIATYGRFTEIDLEADLRLLRVNIVALTHLTKLFARDMVGRGAGRIMNVASAAAFQPGPHRSTYFASKAYVLWFTEALATELKGSGVLVSALCPGPTKTDLHTKAGMAGTKWAHQKKMDPRTVADAGFEGLMKGKTVIIPGWKHKFLAQAVRFVPRSVTRNVVKKMQEGRT